MMSPGQHYSRVLLFLGKFDLLCHNVSGVSVALLYLQLSTVKSHLGIIPYPLCRSPEPEPEPQPAKVTDVRLPTHLEPLTYRLELVPFIIPDNFTIRGLVEIGGQSPVVFI